MFPCHQGELGSGRLGVRTPAPGVANQAACVGVEKQQSLVLPSIGKGWKGRERLLLADWDVAVSKGNAWL